MKKIIISLLFLAGSLGTCLVHADDNINLHPSRELNRHFEAIKSLALAPSPASRQRLNFIRNEAHHTAQWPEISMTERIALDELVNRIDRYLLGEDAAVILNGELLPNIDDLGGNFTLDSAVRPLHESEGRTHVINLTGIGGNSFSLNK